MREEVGVGSQSKSVRHLPGPLNLKNYKGPTKTTFWSKLLRVETVPPSLLSFHTVSYLVCLTKTKLYNFLLLVIPFRSKYQTVLLGRGPNLRKCPWIFCPEKTPNRYIEERSRLTFDPFHNTVI